jgi:IS30 family transposase
MEGQQKTMRWNDRLGGYLISRQKNSHIATLVERHTWYLRLVKVTSKDTQPVISALIKYSKNYQLNFINP